MEKIVLIIALFILKVVHPQSIEDEWQQIMNPVTEADNQEPLYQSCGPNMYCVPPSHCINGKINVNGVKLIAPRSEECDNILECCSEDDVVKQPPTILPVELPPGCGYRKSEGVRAKLEFKTNEAEFGEFPWMVAIFVNENTYHCGGSILHPKVVLTAAHRVYNWQPSKLEVRAGEWERNGENEPLPHQDREVRKIIVHKNFRARTFHNNVALLILKSAFDLSPHVSTVCLPPQGHSFDHANCIVTGWGKAEYTSKKYSNILKRIELKVVPKATCEANLQKTRLGPRFRLQDTHICAGGEAGVDACLGDGGSALVCPIPNTENRYYEAGIVSAGLGCGQKDVPGVYADIARLLPWIENEFKTKNFNLTYLP